MPRMSVYLPQDLYRWVKAEQLPVSEILQEALRERLGLAEKLRAADEYLAWLESQVPGEPTEEEIRAAAESAQRIMEHARRMGKLGGSTAKRDDSSAA